MRRPHSTCHVFGSIPPIGLEGSPELEPPSGRSRTRDHHRARSRAARAYPSIPARVLGLKRPPSLGKSIPGLTSLGRERTSLRRTLGEAMGEQEFGMSDSSGANPFDRPTQGRRVRNVPLATGVALGLVRDREKSQPVPGPLISITLGRPVLSSRPAQLARPTADRRRQPQQHEQVPQVGRGDRVVSSARSRTPRVHAGHAAAPGAHRPRSLDVAAGPSQQFGHVG